jgi:ABC-type enterobactin transport system permease subunit
MKKPVAAIISGMVSFVLVQLLAVFEDPTNVYKGIIIKIIIIGYLVKGLQSAFEAEKIRKQHNI